MNNYDLSKKEEKFEAHSDEDDTKQIDLLNDSFGAFLERGAKKLINDDPCIVDKLIKCL